MYKNTFLDDVNTIIRKNETDYDLAVPNPANNYAEHKNKIRIMDVNLSLLLQQQQQKKLLRHNN